MSTFATAVFTALFLVAASIGVAIAVVRLTRLVRERRRRRRASQPRRVLLAFAADGGAEEEAALVRLPPADWRAIEPIAFDLLAKLRGEAHEALASVCTRRGLVRQARRDLRRRSPARKGRAASVLGSLGDRAAVPALCRLLADPHPDVRVASIHALGRIGDPVAAGPLLASLEAEPPAPAQLVTHSVSQLGPPAVPELIAALDSPSPLVRMTALDALRLLGAAAAESRVASVLQADPVPAVRSRAAATLGRIGARVAEQHLLVACAPDQPAELTASAARALGELGTTSAGPSLRALLSSPDFPTGHEAAKALRALGTEGTATLVEMATGTDRAAAHAREALAMADLQRQRAGTLRQWPASPGA